MSILQVISDVAAEILVPVALEVAAAAVATNRQHMNESRATISSTQIAIKH